MEISKVEIDWSNKKSKISKFFTVGEATFLPRLKVYHTPTDEEKENIVNTAKKLDIIRELLGCPINVHIWIRPEHYNVLVDGAKNSAHITGEAVDFSVSKYTIDEVLDIIQPKCEETGFALENNGSVERITKNSGSGGPRNWIHFQIRPLKTEPFFRMFNP